MSAAWSGRKGVSRRGCRGLGGRECRCSCRWRARADRGCGTLGYCISCVFRQSLPLFRPFEGERAVDSWSRGKRGERTEWSQARIREAREVDVEEYACAICITGAGNVATHAAAGAVGQGRGVCHAGWVFLDDGSVTECASGACGGGEREGRSEGEDGRGMHLVGAWTNCVCC